MFGHCQAECELGLTVGGTFPCVSVSHQHVAHACACCFYFDQRCVRAECYFHRCYDAIQTQYEIRRTRQTCVREGVETHTSAVRKVREINPEVHASYLDYEIFVITFSVRHGIQRVGSRPIRFKFICCFRSSVNKTCFATCNQWKLVPVKKNPINCTFPWQQTYTNTKRTSYTKIY